MSSKKLKKKINKIVSECQEHQVNCSLKENVRFAREHGFSSTWAGWQGYMVERLNEFINSKES